MKKFKYTKLLVSILLSVWITSWLVFAWNGLQATDWDTLTAAKWNELVTKVTGIETNTYTKTEIDNKWYLTSTTWWWVQLSSTCTTSTPWVMNYDSVNELMNICLWWEWQTFASAVKIWWDISKPWLSCKDILDNWWNVWDGLYWVIIWWVTKQVYCDMTTDGWWYMLIVTLTNQTTNITWSTPPWNKGLWTPNVSEFYSMDISSLNQWSDWNSFMIKEWWGKWVATEVSEIYNNYSWKTWRYTWTADNHLLMWKASWNIRWDTVSASYINKIESWNKIRWIKSCSNEWWCKTDWNEGLSIAYWEQNRWPCYSWTENISFWNARWHSSTTRISLCWWWHSDPSATLPLTYWIK